MCSDCNKFYIDKQADHSPQGITKLEKPSITHISNQTLQNSTGHKYTNIQTPWHMEPGGSMLHSQGLSNNPYPEVNQPNSSY